MCSGSWGKSNSSLSQIPRVPRNPRSLMRMATGRRGRSLPAIATATLCIAAARLALTITTKTSKSKLLGHCLMPTVAGQTRCLKPTLGIKKGKPRACRRVWDLHGFSSASIHLKRREGSGLRKAQAQSDRPGES